MYEINNNNFEWFFFCFFLFVSFLLFDSIRFNSIYISSLNGYNIFWWAYHCQTNDNLASWLFFLFCFFFWIGNFEPATTSLCRFICHVILFYSLILDALIPSKENSQFRLPFFFFKKKNKIREKSLFGLKFLQIFELDEFLIELHRSFRDRAFFVCTFEATVLNTKKNLFTSNQK